MRAVPAGHTAGVGGAKERVDLRVAARHVLAVRIGIGRHEGRDTPFMAGVTGGKAKLRLLKTLPCSMNCKSEA